MNVIVAILALGLLIVLHELGHFLVARWCGMRVYEFSIGFGPRLWFIKRGETEYSLRAIFLGGYVRVAGMHPSEEDAKEEGSFLQSAAWKRFLMIAAGPVANYLTAIAIFFLIFGGWGTRDTRVKVQKLQPKSALALAGLQPGDKILAINGVEIKEQRLDTPLHGFWRQLSSHAASGVVMTISRGDKQYKVKFPKMKPEQLRTLGLKAENAKRIRVREVKPKGVAASLGLQAGDILLSVQRKGAKKASPLSEPFALYREVQTKGDFVLKVQRKGAKISLNWPQQHTGKPAAGAKPLDLGLKVFAEMTLRIAEVKAGSPSQAAGLQAGDQVLQVNGAALAHRPARAAVRMAQDALAQCKTKASKLQVLRGGKKLTLQLKPNPNGGCMAGLELRPTEWILVMETLPKSTAQKIGLKEGDRILAIDGEYIGDFYHLLALLRRRIYKPIQLDFARSGKRKSVLVPMAKSSKDWKLGFKPQFDFPRERAGFALALRNSVVQTWRWNVRIWEGLAKIFKGTEKANFTGPVGIVQMAQRTVKQGFNYFLMFVAVISIHLAFFNLLPIPALDGGRLMFLFTQQLLRLFGGKEELGIRIEMFANLIGFFLLFGLLIFITFKDILRIVKKIFG